MTPAPHPSSLRAMDPTSAVSYNVARLRTDLWNRLRDYARRLRRIDVDNPAVSELRHSCADVFKMLAPIEVYHAFPGMRAFREVKRHFDRGTYEPFARHAVRLVRLMASGTYRRFDFSRSRLRDYADLLNVADLSATVHAELRREMRPYFEVLVVDELNEDEIADVRDRLIELRKPEDAFIYNAVVVGSFEDALSAAMVNYNIQSCIIRYSFPFRGAHRLALLNDLYTLLREDPARLDGMLATERALMLGSLLKRLRPELDLFYVTDAPVENVVGEASRVFRRVFYHEESYDDVHLSILKGIHERYETPFFHALKRYSQKPTGVFHALPISRSSSIAKSHWIRDMERFYGKAVFRAETSATTGGLDSLLQPHGSLKAAQRSAARAFGARETFFVTNGTSTANKIVLQALIQPGDIVLVAHDCHKSHHYAVILAGARPIYLDAYPLTEYSMYGAVPLSEIKRHLFALKRDGKLHKVRVLLLTNITFDGITYDPERVMQEVLAIKPDMIFVWDEAWFAYGRFSPTLRHRTAMASIARLRERYASVPYRERYEAWKRETAELDDEALAERELLPDPAKVRLRVYATHSTHKTLTALRQGSMIHVYDQDFEHGARDAFHEAYMTHTSTSPNYQILASLDVGRRQVELEGYEIVQKSIELAMTLRERVRADPQLQQYFKVLGPKHMVTEAYRPSGLDYYFDPVEGWSRIEETWLSDEFVLDPTRVTIEVGSTGMDGDSFKQLLMDRFDIQINKTSRNTVLFMIHIGMTRGTVAHLVKVLTQIAQELDDRLAHQSAVERRNFEAKVRSLTEELPPLPNFSRFHRAFLATPDSATPEGDIRDAFFLAYGDAMCEHLKLDGSLLKAVASGGQEIVSASFVIPYPPGFPVLVPGQVITADIVSYLRALDVKEIHGYEPEYGLRVFKESTLAKLVEAPAAERRARGQRDGVKV